MMRRKHLTDFNAPAPRAVPLSIRLRVLFGGFNNQFGWLFFGFGLIFVWAFTFQADFTSWILFRLPTSSTAGVIESLEESNASEDGVLVYEVSYAFFDQLGRQQGGTSYTTGYPDISGRVSVEYVSSIPSISRISGMRRAVFGAFAAFPVIFPLIGLAFMYFGIRYGLKANRLLGLGKIAFGKLISTESTNARINNRPVIKLTFAFEDQKGEEWEVTATTHEPAGLRDEAEEPLLYDPDNPDYAVLLDDLPGSTTFDSSGQLVPGGFLETGMTVLIPGLTVIGHGMYLLIRAIT
jgi:hypothetical protein